MPIKLTTGKHKKKRREEKQSLFCLAGHMELTSKEITGMLYRPRLL